jgi:diguanylate cyclase (GGDEF)-like protein
LTGLPNRILFFDLVERAIKRAERRPDYAFALLVLGLDRIEVVHDSLGPLGADRLLVAVAQRLQSSLRSTDALTRDALGATLARVGGDEFNVLLDDITDVRDAIRVAERLRHALEEPFEVDGNQLFISATTGIAVSTTGYDQPAAIVRDATTALNRARANGASQYEIFDPAMRARAVSRLQVETDLRRAIETRAFEVHYQPIVSFDSGRIAGFEALLRWRHPVRGLVSPAEFIPIAEDTGMILDIGRLVLAESCRQMAAWQGRFGLQAPHIMCANISSRQFAEGDLVAEIAAILEQTGLAPSKLKLEITETAFISDVLGAHGIVRRAQSMGIEWSLDDFGTGYSSLSYLHQLGVDTVKVDRSFVNLMGTQGTGSEMVRAIVALAHNLGMDVVAEGVETAEQFAELQDLGCEYAQGFYFSKPVDTAAADLLIASQPWCSTSLSSR